MFRVNETDIGEILDKRRANLKDDLWRTKQVTYSGKDVRVTLSRGNIEKMVNLVMDPQYEMLIEWDSKQGESKVQAYRYWPRYGYYYVRGEAAGTI